MKIIFRAEDGMLDEIRADLSRPHSFAAERIGWISAKATMANDTLLLLAQRYHPIDDRDYVRDYMVGARIGPEAMRKAMNLALLEGLCMFHVHQHEHRGRPRFSRTDLLEQPKMIPDFFGVRRDLPHGALLLSHDSMIGRVWLSRDQIEPIDEINYIGQRLRVAFVRRSWWSRK